MGGAAAWENAPKSDGAARTAAMHALAPMLTRLPLSVPPARCPKCDHTRAYYFQLQIRSADEPMTTFYKCCSCGHQWNDQS